MCLLFIGSYIAVAFIWLWILIFWLGGHSNSKAENRKSSPPISTQDVHLPTTCNWDLTGICVGSYLQYMLTHQLLHSISMQQLLWTVAGNSKSALRVWSSFSIFLCALKHEGFFLKPCAMISHCSCKHLFQPRAGMPTLLAALSIRNDIQLEAQPGLLHALFSLMITFASKQTLWPQEKQGGKEREQLLVLS